MGREIRKGAHGTALLPSHLKLVPQMHMAIRPASFLIVGEAPSRVTNRPILRDSDSRLLCSLLQSYEPQFLRASSHDHQREGARGRISIVTERHPAFVQLDSNSVYMGLVLFARARAKRVTIRHQELSGC